MTGHKRIFDFDLCWSNITPMFLKSRIKLASVLMRVQNYNEFIWKIVYAEVNTFHSSS
jgi:hypothetical protein